MNLTNQQLNLFVIVGMMLAITISCKKEANTSIPPELTTLEASQITFNSIVSGGKIVSTGNATIQERGICWGTNANPTVTDNKKEDVLSDSSSFNIEITNLASNTTYYVRAYATSATGTTYGNPVSFTLWMNSPGETITDADGNVYSTIKIGTQVWMGENLKTTKYNDGTPIPLTPDKTEWFNLTTPGYCWYNNDETNYKSKYGALYNWYCVNSGKLCPQGWHIPTYTEWNTLVKYLGGNSVAGGKLKETGTLHWKDPNTGATNETGFKALPGGFRRYNGEFLLCNSNGDWWSSTELETDFAYNCIIHYDSNHLNFFGQSIKTFGYSVRCIKD